MNETKSMVLAAYAKVNLALAVGPPMPPKGYHPIASWFVGVDLHDTVQLDRLGDRERSRYTIRWADDAPKATPIDWPVEKDLAVQAHRLLEAHTGRALPVAMVLDKRIPVGGGLGGGSSDAAAMMKGVNALFGLGLSGAQLAGLSGSLGSDIAFFVGDSATPPTAPPQPAMVTGFGNGIERLRPAPATDVLLIVPPFGCPTGPVYQVFDRVPTRRVDDGRVRAAIEGAVAKGRIQSESLFNDLAEAACMVEPRLRGVLSALRTALGPGLPVHVTGSGSTMFCLPSAHATDEAAAAIRRADSSLVVMRSRLI